jgi:cell division protein FtsI (penicillin-binding protein 3)
MSGVVFHHIAEGVMARNLKMSVEDARDEHSVFIPEVKGGNSKDANYVLNKLGIRKRMANDVKTKQDITPDVVGMGAKDAVYLLESHGLRVKLVGRGKVKKQSYPAGKAITENSECILTLE